ncbi:MAG: hypothetical protein R2941_10150 [Desulfobacterales bacterium]
MAQISHDQNFKNLFLDFPVEALEWILPETLQQFGPVAKYEFVRQEPKKQKLTDAGFLLDLPILFTFRNRKQMLLWLTEFQEDKQKFSIYKLLHYTADKMEAYPEALVVPTVIFSDRRRWKKDVIRQLDAQLNSRVLLHFEYIFLKLFDYQAADYYNCPNPVVKILLPKMQYKPEERWEVIRQAYIGLFQLASAPLFQKYADFIDIYAEVGEEERDMILSEMKERKEFFMIRKYLMEEGLQKGLEKGLQKGLQKGLEKGLEKGLHEGHLGLLSRQMMKKYQRPFDDMKILDGLRPEDMLVLGEMILDCDTFSDIEKWIQQRKTGNLS